MTEKRWLYFALGVTTVISVGAVTNQLVPVAPATGLELSDSGITFPDGTVQSTAAARDPRRLFYLTASLHDGAQALGACGTNTGFHMASMWEIADVGTLSYDFDNPNALTRGDSGEGPPTNAFGWVRTGNFTAHSSFNAGIANCDAWTHDVNLPGSGTIARLSSNWTDPAAGGLALVWGTPWAATTEACSLPQLVWCVEDYPGAAS